MILARAHNETHQQGFAPHEPGEPNGLLFDRMDHVRGLGVESENGGKP